MRIVFSRDRAAQLDLLLQSLERNAEPEPTTVIWRASDDEYWRGYIELARIWGSIRGCEESEFETDVRYMLGQEYTSEADEYVTFLCDDDVLFTPLTMPNLEDDVLCFSPRLGFNTLRCYPTSSVSSTPNLVTRGDKLVWQWRQT